MNKYTVISLIGEGSFGRVFKAETKRDKEPVAIKLITKCGRSQKELKGLRAECEIQRKLEHPNIIRMLDSFETDNEIAVVTEFAFMDLHKLIYEKCYLDESNACKIIYDLVAALYYLHSNRVLHRDLKPQNVLLTQTGAKLCDFGFARNMSIGTHVLTSIKGTPLYMAPELIDECPYDHNADLWALGCVCYEMLVGKPPFSTPSILQLIKMIRLDPIIWPEYLSLDCQSFLKGLLEKDPTQRLTWPYLLEHPFLKGNVLVLDDAANPTPFTVELTSSQAKTKAKQKKDLSAKILKTLRDATLRTGTQAIHVRQSDIMQTERAIRALTIGKPIEMKDFELESELKEAIKYSENENYSQLPGEEWLAFLQCSMEEMMAGDVQSIKDPAFVNMICKALSSDSPIVISYIGSLFSLPFTIDFIDDENLIRIKQVYSGVKLVQKLVFACKILMARTDNLNNLSADQLEALETVYFLITNLLHDNDVFLIQFCKLCKGLILQSHLMSLLSLRKRKIRLTSNIIAILCQILRRTPEYSSIVTDVVKCFHNPDAEFHSMLMSSNECLSARTLALIKLMLKECPDSLQVIRSEDVLQVIQSGFMENIDNRRSFSNKSDSLDSGGDWNQ